MYRIKILIYTVLGLIVLGSSANAAKNVILMIGDGMSFQHVNAGSYYLNGAVNTLSFEPHYKCSITTRSLNNSITDSAAAASALATGYKVNNNAVSQSPTGQEHTTIMQIASALGKSTGFVTTDPITRATPAAFASHDPSRYNYLDIADDYLNATRPNVMFGGGATQSTESEFFSTAQIAHATAIGYKTVFDSAGLAYLDPSNNRALGLFSLKEMPYEYDGYPSTMPHLNQMTAKALDLLSADSDGFFLMVEGAKIDWAAHARDIRRTTEEVVEFNNTTELVMEWMAGRDDTLLLITGDHETGGLTSGNRGKGNYPSATWTSTDHTAANVPLYAFGCDTNLIDSYIVNGVADNTDIFKVMNTSLNSPVPEPSAIVSMLCGLGGIGIYRMRRKQ